MTPAISYPSPNHGFRKGGVGPEIVVLHYTAFSTSSEALDRLCDADWEVSSHYLIGRCGTCWQLVDEDRRAWHAGAGSWGGLGDINSRSIGIELDNDGSSPFSNPLMASLESLLPEILIRWQIPAHRVIGHSDMAPGRKIDPGLRFDWQRLARQGLACWPQASAGNEWASAPEAPAPHSMREVRMEERSSQVEADFVADLMAFGYPSEMPPAQLLAAFRARFRPFASGPLTATDCADARDLARRFPVDAPGMTA